MKEAIILFAHGSRDPQWAAPMRTIFERVASRRPQTHIALAFLELMAPNLHEAVTEAVAQGAQSISVVPLFLAAGGHLKNDLPKLVAQSAKLFPEVQITTLPPIGESAELLDAIANWVCATVR